MVSDRVVVATGFGSSKGGLVSTGMPEAAGADGVTGAAELEGADVFVAPVGEVADVAAGAVTVGRGDVAGRFALLAESFCEGRMGIAPETSGVRDGTVGAGVIWAVGASPGEMGFRVVAAGRAGMTGACVEVTGGVSPAPGAAVGRGASIGCCGWRGVSGI